LIGVILCARAEGEERCTRCRERGNGKDEKGRPAYRKSLRHGAIHFVLRRLPRTIRECLQFYDPSTQSITKVWPIRDMAWPDCGGFTVG
jgi:hypothetical protein